MFVWCTCEYEMSVFVEILDFCIDRVTLFIQMTDVHKLKVWVFFLFLILYVIVDLYVISVLSLFPLLLIVSIFCVGFAKNIFVMLTCLTKRIHLPILFFYKRNPFVIDSSY